MSDAPTPLPPNPSLVQLQKQAKERVRAERGAGKADATLAEAQFALAREYGFENWAKLRHHIESLRPPGIAPFERLAAEIAAAYSSGDEQRVRAINAQQGTSFPTDLHDPAKVQQCLPTWYASEARSPALALTDARQMVAHAYGFETWPNFTASLSQAPADPRSAAVFRSPRPPFYQIDWQANRLSARGPQSRRDWEEIFAIIEEYGISKLTAAGIPDEAMAALAALEGVTSLDISGSKALTDEGAQQLTRMPQLTSLEIGGWHTALTPRAFEPLRHLLNLREFKSCWTQGFTDDAAAYLAACERVEGVNVMGSLAGDGLIRALAGKSELRFLETGRGVTDAGIPALRHIPAFQTWSGGEVRTGLMGSANLANRLMIDGDFTDAGIATLTDLEGVAALSFFWHSRAFTPAGLEHLRRLPHLELLGIDGSQCGDDAMREIAALPRLRQLQAQGATAGDRGWQSLAAATKLEYVWGRDCPNFTGRGFAALADMPALRGFGISCRQVDDGALALLPQFPRLRELVSIDIADDGFRHIGRCANLESLYCMYCRDTGDAATEHLAGLRNLRTYYAGMTRITDNSLEVLSRIESLENLEFWQCMSLSDAGFAHLARLPKLRQIEIHGAPRVSSSITALFGDNVRVVYSG